MRPVLRPGLRSLQVHGMMHLTDSACDVPVGEVAADVVAAVDGLRDAETVLALAGDRHRTAEVDSAWRWLLQRHLLVDADAHLERVAGLPRPSAAGAHTPLLDLLGAPDGERRWQARTGCTVRVEGRGSTTDRVTEMLAASGVRLIDPRDHASTADDLVLLTDDHEPSAQVLEQFVRADTIHLIGGLRDGELRVGPLVVPGWTACSRCHDLHRAGTEPSWRWRRALLSEAAVHPLGASTVALPLLSIAAALMVTETLSFVEGRVPLSCGGILTQAADQPLPRRLPLDPHPWCGCVWPA